jgi:hypothetical protein
MATSKGILGEEMILSSISIFSINLLVNSYNCVKTVIALAALNSFVNNNNDIERCPNPFELHHFSHFSQFYFLFFTDHPTIICWWPVMPVP